MTSAAQQLRTMVRSRGGWLLLTGLVVPRAASTLTVFATSAVLGPDGRGIIAFVLATSSLVATVAGFGLFIPAAATRGADSASGAAPTVARQYLDLTIALTLLADAALVVFALLAPAGLLNGQTAGFIAVNALATAVLTFVQRVLQARVSDFDYFLIGALPAIVTNTVLIIVVLWWPDTTGYLLVLTVLGVAATGWGVLRLRGRVRLVRARPYAAGSYLRRAAPVGVSLIGTMLVLRGDITVLGMRSSEEQVGLYSMAVAIAGLLFLVTEVFALRAVSAHQSTDPADYPDLVAGLARGAVVAVALTSVPLAGLAWFVLTVVLPAFSAAFVPMLVLSAAGLASTYSRVMTGALGMVGADRRLYSYALVSIGLFLLYLPAASFGAIGVAVASLVIYLLQIPVVGGRSSLRST